MKMDLKLNIFTLNCWGIVGVSRHRKERMSAIASHIAASNYDFVFLQEVWSEDDYQMICKKTATVLPYSYYFYSGVIGSGVCILSQSKIVDAAQYQYTLNGYAHKVLHGDWFGGKVVGLCKIIHHGLRINLYVTHLHAEYDCFHDQYLSHRVAQAFEFSQFVKLTSETADLSIIAGDFNAEPSDLPYRLIVHNIGCYDSFLMQPNGVDGIDVRATCGHPQNIYTCRKEIQICPTGKRIDYIMYKCGKGTSVNTLLCDTPLQKIPDSTVPYSDHEAVVSELHVFKSADAAACETNLQARVEAIESAHDILLDSIKDLNNNRVFYLLMACLILSVLLISIPIELPYGFGVFLIFLRVILSLCLGFCVWMGIVMNRIEYSALLSACKSMGLLMGNLKGECSIDLPMKYTDSHSEIIL